MNVREGFAQTGVGEEKKKHHPPRQYILRSRMRVSPLALALHVFCLVHTHTPRFAVYTSAREASLRAAYSYSLVHSTTRTLELYVCMYKHESTTEMSVRPFPEVKSSFFRLMLLVAPRHSTVGEEISQKASCNVM